MKILIAPNAFKGTLGPLAAAHAIESALEIISPGAETVLLPISDGGDGLLEAFMRPEHKLCAAAGASGNRLRVLRTFGPALKPVRARWLLSGSEAVIEMAEAAGLKRMAGSAMAPLTATTFGVGRLIRAAVRAGARSVLIGLGGSASSDGGAGCAAGFGFRLLDKNGVPVPNGAEGLLRLERILPPAGSCGLTRISVTALTDVDNTLCGSSGSARVYGPQKGAGPAEVAVLEKALLHYARVVKRELGPDIRSLKGGAAAGGLGAGLCAFFGARLIAGADYILDRLDFEAAAASSDLVITGEGRFDAQSFRGKAPVAAARLALRHKKPVLLVCGSCAVKDRRLLAANGIAGVIALDELLPLSDIMASPARALTKGVLMSVGVVSSFVKKP
jgi:glycerate kinase